jgi:hypothetical protein
MRYIQAALYVYSFVNFRAFSNLGVILSLANGDIKARTWGRYFPIII